MYVYIQSTEKKMFENVSNFMMKNIPHFNKFLQFITFEAPIQVSICLKITSKILVFIDLLI